MFVPSILTYNNNINPKFQANPKTRMLSEVADLKVFHHHIYEFKKGVRHLILTTEKSKYKETIEKRLQHENIDYVIHDIDKNKINVYFGEKDCIEVVKSFNTIKLNELTAEQDFMLGIMLGYDRVKQCGRYMKIKNNIIKLGKQPLSNQKK